MSSIITQYMHLNVHVGYSFAIVYYGENIQLECFIHLIKTYAKMFYHPLISQYLH
jgi:hypothetical protein